MYYYYILLYCVRYVSNDAIKWPRSRPLEYLVASRKKERKKIIKEKREKKRKESSRVG